jgi:hypothetical protein
VVAALLQIHQKLIAVVAVAVVAVAVVVDQIFLPQTHPLLPVLLKSGL